MRFNLSFHQLELTGNFLVNVVTILKRNNNLHKSKCISNLGKSLGTLRDHSSITSATRWVGGVRKGQFLLIYITIYADVLRWVGRRKKAKNMLT